MKVSKKERYALRLMIDLATHSRDGKPVGVRAIAERQDIARRYLEQIAAQLRRSGLLVARQGQSGGYLLARPAHTISVGDVIEAVAGREILLECLSDDDACQRRAGCPSRRMWKLLETLMRSVLHQYSLDDLAEGRLPDAADPMEIAHWSKCPLANLGRRVSELPRREDGSS